MGGCPLGALLIIPTRRNLPSIVADDIGTYLVRMTSVSPSTVLLVDDGLAERKLFAMAGKKAGVGYVLQEVGDGADAIRYLKGEGHYADRAAHPFPALVVLDVNMPGMSGFEVLEWIRGDSQTRDLPVVMWTSSSCEDDVRRAYSLGANSYLVKPLSLILLVDTVRVIENFWLKLNRAPRMDDASPAESSAHGGTTFGERSA